LLDLLFHFETLGSREKITRAKSKWRICVSSIGSTNASWSYAMGTGLVNGGKAKRISNSVASFDMCLALIHKSLRNAFAMAERGGVPDITSSRAALLLGALTLSLATVGCASRSQRPPDPLPPGAKGEFTSVTVKGPVQLRLKAQPKTSETIDYYHVSASRAFEGQELRHEKTETLTFTAQAETTKTETIKADAASEEVPQEVPIERFTQAITVLKKDGTIGLHDFAMPEVGERLELITDSRGRILKAGDWPTNSIFYVPPVSLPEDAVEVGDTWAMQSTWLSLQDMVPYELDMVSILKGFVKCGDDTCADIEVNGNVAMQGALKQTLVFRSEWRGRLLFALNAGTVSWSRINSEELFAYDKVYRTVGSCLEAALREPGKASVVVGDAKPTCQGFAPPSAMR
jgi:hypothetical protein